MTTYDAGIIFFMYVEGKSKFSKVKNENQLEEGGAYFVMTFFFFFAKLTNAFFKSKYFYNLKT